MTVKWYRPSTLKCRLRSGDSCARSSGLSCNPWFLVAEIAETFGVYVATIYRLGAER